ncbi:winged helix-turn-helix transcriptional regulator [Kribbella sp. NPDC051586]|uniref:winged helix-turn-helix transcriptional regulator n=1 Tax=Kribbella sp. NPDC051586 TaxID=3364118 RepID=UPI0037A4A805
MRGSATGRPLMAALDLFGRRWTLRIVWELRLRELLATGIVRLQEDRRYELTELGADVYRALRPLIRWSERWADEQSGSAVDG